MGKIEFKEGLGSNFIRTFIEEDLRSGKCETVHTRFPPEPNGYLHIGHAKSMVINFEIAREYNGLCNLRFDDTNPEKEDIEYEEAIKRDIKWLGYDWEDRLYYASDYFEKLYEFAEILIKKNLAYVCDLKPEELKDYRGNLSEPGKNSPFCNRSIEENLDLFKRMREGEFEEGSKVLRAKIDMSSPNINMRDPVMYRILKKNHHRTGNKWCIYPSYDFTHGQSDSIERISHSLCSLEFENHRPLYEWFIEKLGIYNSRQIEFSRLNLTYTITSKRYLRELVEREIVEDWDDPRMPTLIGMRRRGITPEAIIEFLKCAGVSKKDNFIDVSNFEYYIRENLKKNSAHIMAVLNPVKLTIINYPDGKTEKMEMDTFPNNENLPKRQVPFTKNLFVEKSDYSEENESTFYRLSPGKFVKLRKAYIIKCLSALKDESGEITEIICEYIPETSKSTETDGKKVKGIIHWVSQSHCTECTVRMYDRLFTVENPLEAKDKEFKDLINSCSLTIMRKCKIEDSVKTAKPEDRFQFERNGYFCLDMKDSSQDNLVFNKTLTLK